MAKKAISYSFSLILVFQAFFEEMTRFLSASLLAAFMLLIDSCHDFESWHEFGFS
jgi:hypothetical protein